MKPAPSKSTWEARGPSVFTTKQKKKSLASENSAARRVKGQGSQLVLATVRKGKTPA